MTVAVIVPHYDDETLGAAGTLLRHVKQGDFIWWVVVCNIWDDDPMSRQEKEKRRDTIARAYNFGGSEVFDFPSTRLDEVPYRRVFDRVTDFLDRRRPDIIYTIGPGDVHSDHQILHNVMMGATRSSYWKGKAVYGMEICSSTHSAWSDHSSRFRPTRYVDIGEFMNQKLQILSMYHRELRHYPHARSIQAITALGMVRGASVGVEYAEAFMTLREVWR